jgi:hypothetical protein
MINFQLRDFIASLEHLDLARMRARSKHELEPMDAQTRLLIRMHIGRIEKSIIDLGMLKAAERYSRLVTALDASSTYGMILREIEELWNSIDSDTHEQFFCHYPVENAKIVLGISREWGVALKAFPSARQEIESGVDCYGLGHITACIFHMCRVGEIGLLVIAKERGIRSVKGGKVPIDHATWGQVMQKIDQSLENIRQKPNGPRKDAALAFYSTVHSDLRAILNLYRDKTMHLRDKYDDGEARSAMFRARELMVTLAGRLTEGSIRAIPWTAW